jgi:hypothetical protein
METDGFLAVGFRCQSIFTSTKFNLHALKGVIEEKPTKEPPTRKGLKMTSPNKRRNVFQRLWARVTGRSELDAFRRHDAELYRETRELDEKNVPGCWQTDGRITVREDDRANPDSPIADAKK